MTPTEQSVQKRQPHSPRHSVSQHALSPRITSSVSPIPPPSLSVSLIHSLSLYTLLSLHIFVSHPLSVCLPVCLQQLAPVCLSL